MSNFCSSCGTQGSPDQRFCGACGASLNAETSQETIASPHRSAGGESAAATRELAGRSCPYCRFPLKEGGAIATCPACNAVHHADCYAENGGCAVAGCTAGPSHQTATAPLWAGSPQPDPRAPDQLAHHAVPTAAGGIGIHQPDPTPPSTPPPGRHRVTFAIVAIALVMLLLAGGATALLLVHKNSGTKAAASVPTTVPTDNGTTTPATTSASIPTQTNANVTTSGTVPTETTPAATTPPAPTTPSTTTSDPGTAALNAVNTHWQDIKTGDYNDAYQLLTPASINGSSQSDWVSSHQQDGIRDVQYSFNLTWVHGDQAQVDVNQLQTTAQTDVTPSNPSGCTHFTGHYIVINQNGNWLINEVHLNHILSC